MSDLVVREYGRGTRFAVVLHGGPAAAGDLGPFAQVLGERWHALEPFQRGSGGRRLSVGLHIQDLDDVIRERCEGRRPIIVGHSWGAMLALAYAAEHPATPLALALIGCGTFSETGRREFEARLDARLSAADRAAIARLQETETDAGRRLAALGRLMTRVYGYDADVDCADDGGAQIDAVAHDETWADMLRLQRDGVYPAAFRAIRVPVLMLHGEVDPHPGRSIWRELRENMPQVEYQELPRCGHSPWLERQARDAFFDALQGWLTARFG